jgi:hypothetical protein
MFLDSVVQKKCQQISYAVNFVNAEISDTRFGSPLERNLLKVLLTKVTERDESCFMSNTFFSVSVAVSEINNVKKGRRQNS